jgi:hypothetical protein
VTVFAFSHIFSAKTSPQTARTFFAGYHSALVSHGTLCAELTWSDKVRKYVFVLVDLLGHREVQQLF